MQADAIVSEAREPNAGDPAADGGQARNARRTPYRSVSGARAQTGARSRECMRRLLQPFRDRCHGSAPLPGTADEGHRVLHCGNGYRVELTTASWEQEGIPRDCPWAGMHWVIDGRIALCRYDRRPLAGGEGLFALDATQRLGLETGTSLVFAPHDGAVHEIASRAPVARVLSLYLTSDPGTERCWYEPVADSGCFDETPVVWAVPMSVRHSALPA